MTSQEKEYATYGLTGLGLIGLYMLSQRSKSGGGLGQTYQAQIILANTTGPAVSNVKPGTMIQLQLGGVLSGDFVDTNLDTNGDLDPNWTSSFSDPNHSYGGGSQIVWQKVGMAPSQPGNYTVLAAVNGQIVAQVPLTVSMSGASGQTGWYSPLNQVSPDIYTPAFTQQTSAAAQTAFAAASGSGAATTPPPSSPVVQPTAAQPTPTTSVATSPSLDLSSLEGLLSGTIMGLPAWAVILGGVGVVWYLSSRK
jgi:hypothetical protein